MAKDQRGYEELIKPIEDKMIRSVWRIVRDPDDADDAFQEALETVWRKLDKIRRHQNPQALILRICVNCSYDVLRRRARRQRREEIRAIPEQVADPAPSVAEQIAATEQRSHILGAVGRLPRQQAQAILMRFFQELSYDQIAQALGCTEATARRHIACARLRLRKMLTQQTLNA